MYEIRKFSISPLRVFELNGSADGKFRIVRNYGRFGIRRIFDELIFFLILNWGGFNVKLLELST